MLAPEFILFHSGPQELFLAVPLSKVMSLRDLSELPALLWASVSTSASQVRNLASLPLKESPEWTWDSFEDGQNLQPVLLMLTVALGPGVLLGVSVPDQIVGAGSQLCRVARGSGNSSALPWRVGNMSSRVYSVRAREL